MDRDMDKLEVATLYELRRGDRSNKLKFWAFLVLVFSVFVTVAVFVKSIEQSVWIILGAD